MKTEVVSAFKLGIDALLNPKKYKGFFGISSTYPFFSDESVEDNFERAFSHKKIEDFLEFGVSYFNEFLVFIVDSPLKYNIAAFENVEYKRAAEISEKIGNIWEERLKKISGRNVLISRWRDIEENPRFQSLKEKIRSYALQDNRFNKELTDLTISATWNKLKHIKSVRGWKGYKESLNIARGYSIEDTALSLFLFSDFPIGISKYETPLVIRSIYNHLFPRFENILDLPVMGHIQVSFENTVRILPYDDLEEDKNEHLAKT